MHHAQALVREFHEAFGHPIADKPTTVDVNLSDLRYDLIVEEVGEYHDAVREGNLVEIADALGDILCVTYGAALVHGIDLEPIFEAIHQSNMSKLDPATGRPVPHPTIPGKIGKGANYAPPTDAIRAELERQGHRR